MILLGGRLRMKKYEKRKRKQDFPEHLNINVSTGGGESI